MTTIHGVKDAGDDSHCILFLKLRMVREELETLLKKKKKKNNNNKRNKSKDRWDGFVFVSHSVV